MPTRGSLRTALASAALLIGAVVAAPVWAGAARQRRSRRADARHANVPGDIFDGHPGANAGAGPASRPAHWIW